MNQNDEGPVRSFVWPAITALLICALLIPRTAAAQSRADSTHTVQFRMWSLSEGTPAEFDLVIDGDDKGPMSNTDAPTVIEVTGLRAGRHTLELRNITFYRGMAVVDAGRSCSKTFFVIADGTQRLYARLLGGDVACGVH